MGKRIVLAGGAGFVGQNLAPLLLERGERVVALDKHAGNLRLLARLNPGLEAVRADLSQDGDWDVHFAGADAVVDLKAQIASRDPALFARNNVRTQERILAACRAHRVQHLLHLSSSAVLSVVRDAYSESKREAEALVRDAGVPLTILRPPLMYGPFDVKHLGFIAAVMERTPVLPVPGSGRFLRQPLFVLDLCHVVLRCLERGPSGHSHDLIGQERLSFLDMLRELARARGLRRLLLPVPLPLFAAALRLYGAGTRRPAVTGEQLDALIAGDDFPVEDWPAAFAVPYTAFRDGLRLTFASPRYAHTREMALAH
jgi:nucleoside-diphosphate-sugar epimerase